MSNPQLGQEQRMERDRSSYDNVDVGRERGIDDPRPAPDPGEYGELKMSGENEQIAAEVAMLYLTYPTT